VSTTVKIGDTVTATNKKTGNTATFEVRDSKATYVASAEHVFYRDAWDFERHTPPLPEKPGLYRIHGQNGKPDTSLSNYKRAVLTTRGEWFWLDFTAQAVSVLKPVSEDFADQFGDGLALVYGGTE
jgi:hypothetical protein